MSDANRLRLFLFTTSPDAAEQAASAGIDALMVDWEWRGKEQRQFGADTEINSDTPEDLAALAASPLARCCRLNRFGPWTAGEVETALENHATDILLPMVETPDEVERFLSLLDGRARAGILIETLSADACAADLARLPLSWVYLGLNDLRLERQRPLFEPLIDGTADRLRQLFAETAFGVGGLTVLDGGSPIPCRILLAELARLDCDFTFLRRSFKRDIKGRDWSTEIARLHTAWTAARRREPGQIQADHNSLRGYILQEMASRDGVRPDDRSAVAQ